MKVAEWSAKKQLICKISAVIVTVTLINIVILILFQHALSPSNIKQEHAIIDGGHKNQYDMALVPQPSPLIVNITSDINDRGDKSNDMTRVPQLSPLIVNRTSVTLALVDPYIIGGFRNQHMRFIGLLRHAMEINATGILLESVRWAGLRGDAGLVGVPHELLFDVDYWNNRTRSLPSNNLPRLVRFSSEAHGACWDNKVNLFHVLDAPVVLDPDSFNIRRQDLLTSAVQNCTQPYGYGSGKGVGRLWSSYQGLKSTIESDKIVEGRHPLEVSVYQALRPSKIFQRIVERVTSGGTGTTNGRILVVHPRVEIDMLRHKCSKLMVKNLTHLVHMMESSDLLIHADSHLPVYDTIFLAINRREMIHANQSALSVRVLAEENLRRLNMIVSQGLWNASVPILESGERSVLGILPNNYGADLAGSLVNFFIAVNADTFLGTYGSSYSTDVWTARYFLGKGANNLVHSHMEIGRVSNGGLPPTHKVCK